MGLAVGMLAVTGCSPEASTEHFELAFADGFSSSHPIGAEVVQPFLEELEETGPSVNLSVKYFPAGSLGDPDDMLDLMRTGAIDMGQLVPSNQSTQLPLASVGDLPGVSENHCQSVEAMSSLMSEGGIVYEEELQRHEVRPVFLASIPNYEIITRDRKIESPEDLRGLALRSGGGAGDRLVQLLGAGAVAMPGPDVYEGVSRGTIDGALFPPLSVVSYSLQEVTGYATDGLDIMSVTSGFGISDEAWDEMTQDQRDVVAAAGRVAQGLGCEGLEGADAEANALIDEGGAEMVEISEDERKAWTEAAVPIQQEWADELDARGLPGGDVLDAFRTELESLEDDEGSGTS